MPIRSRPVAAVLTPHWTPFRLPALVGWWDAELSRKWTDSARTTPAGVDGDLGGAWDDLSGKNNHMTQATGANRPTLKSVSGSGWTWRFDGAASFFNVPSIDLTTSDKMTLVVVWKGIGAAAATIVIENSANYNLNQPAYLINRQSPDGTAVAIKGNIGYSDRQNTGDRTTGLQVTIMTADMALTTLEVAGYENGVSLPNTLNNADNTNAGFANQVSYVGARGGTSLFLSGDISAVILTQGAIDAGLQRLVNRYYAKRFNIWGAY